MAESVARKVRNEFESWYEDAEVTGALSVTSISESEGIILLEFESTTCTLTCPSDYPSGEFYLDCPDQQEWADKVNDYCMGSNPKAKEVFQKMADLILEMNLLGGGDDDACFLDDGEAGAEEEEHDPYADTAPREKHWDEVDEKYSKQKFVHETSDNATKRLISDVKCLLRSNPRNNGYTAQPLTVNGAENLYEWVVKLYDFDGDLGADLKTWEKRNPGKDYVELRIQFSKDYPFKPPFVRVIEPRFMFRTGNVTLGGAICMEMLTLTGWNAINSIDSIIMTVRAQMNSPDSKGRLDFNASGSSYSEAEAWQAFHRAAATHGWNSKGLGPEMFPKFH